ncbi:hypothetical protein GW17_00048454 [Ensete ventricosum]|nr:hypothetical protein GW17_00048454 [Ensete ventricosum]
MDGSLVPRRGGWLLEWQSSGQEEAPQVKSGASSCKEVGSRAYMVGDVGPPYLATLLPSWLTMSSYPSTTPAILTVMHASVGNDVDLTYVRLAYDRWGFDLTCAKSVVRPLEPPYLHPTSFPHQVGQLSEGMRTSYAYLLARGGSGLVPSGSSGTDQTERELRNLNGAGADSTEQELGSLNGARADPTEQELGNLNGARADPTEHELGNWNDAGADPTEQELGNLNGARADPIEHELGNLNGARADPTEHELENLNLGFCREGELEHKSWDLAESREGELGHTSWDLAERVNSGTNLGIWPTG